MSDSWLALLPLVILAGAALLLLMLEAFLKSKEKTYLGYIAAAALVGCGYTFVRFWNKQLSFFKGSLKFDNPSLLFGFLFLLTGLFVILISLKYVSLVLTNIGEFYPLLLFGLAGLVIMATSVNLLVIFLGLEVLSVSSYALAGLRLKEAKSSEAAVKYFLLGSFAGAFFVFGLALLFGASGSVDIPALAQCLAPGSATAWLGLAGLALVLASLAFKIALVPFHMWTPDVYEGAPTPVAAFFSVGPKAAGFAVLLRLLSPYWKTGFRSGMMFWILYVLAALTMVVANLAALRQTNVKRLLAYSSIAQAGTILVAVLAGDPEKLLFYLGVYVFMNLGAFAAVSALGRRDAESVELDDYAGLGFKYPWLGATLSIFLLSLAGFPPTAGFLAKFYVFSSAVRQGLTPLVIIGVLASLVSVYYYLKIIVFMYMRPPSHEVEAGLQSPELFLVLFLCLYGVLQLGINPGNILALIRQAVTSLL
jgi:NADH-quinone oxidoreductase subunit N